MDFANVSCVPDGSKSKSGYSSNLTQFNLYSERLSLTVAIVESITSKEISSDSIFLAISMMSFALINVPPSLKFLMISTPLNLYGTWVLIVKSEFEPVIKSPFSLSSNLKFAKTGFAVLLPTALPATNKPLRNSSLLIVNLILISFHLLYL